MSGEERFTRAIWQRTCLDGGKESRRCHRTGESNIESLLSLKTEDLLPTKISLFFPSVSQAPLLSLVFCHLISREAFPRIKHSFLLGESRALSLYILSFNIQIKMHPHIHCTHAYTHTFMQICKAMPFMNSITVCWRPLGSVCPILAPSTALHQTWTNTLKHPRNCNFSLGLPFPDTAE